MTSALPIVLAASLAMTGAPAAAEDAQVAVAANFAGPLRALAAAFEKETGHHLLLSPGSTGKFYAQIRNGAPYEVLLSADDETPRRLEEERHTVPGSRFTYALGRLVLWSAAPGTVDGQGAVLKGTTFRKLAMANPKLAPYGAAAQEVMARLGVWQALQPRLVLGENIAQTHQFVASGNAELGFVALSQVAGEAQGSRWLVPATLHAPLRQDAVLLNKGRNNRASRAFLDYLRTPAAQAQIEAFGYELPR